MSTRQKKNNKTIGIDLGTTFSAVTHLTESGAVEIIPNIDGDLKTPSIASFAGDKTVVGKAAQIDLILNPQYVVRCSKRYIGKTTDKGRPIPILTDPSGGQITSVDAAAAILSYLKDSAEQYLGKEVDSAVVTVPAYFDEVARENTKAAAIIAGLKDVAILDEPVSAAVSYCLEKQKDGIVGVIDFGGGTLDASALEIEGTNLKTTVICGDCELGGSNYDEMILNFMICEARADGIEISAESDLATFYQNGDRAREGKEMLARRDEVTLIAEAGGNRKPIKFTRQMLRKIAKPLDDRFIACCEKLRDQLQAKGKRLDSIILVGGSSRLFPVPEMVKKIFSIEPCMDTDTDLVVAKGAALWATICFGDKDQKITVGADFLPAGQIQVQTVTAHAICVAAMKRSSRNDSREYNCEIVPANTPLPYTFEERFSPVNSDQTSVMIRIIQGVPGELSENSTLLREINVPIQPTDHDKERIKICGCYNAEGILEITVVDEVLGKPVSDSFTYSTGLTQAEIDEKRKQLKQKGGK